MLGHCADQLQFLAGHHCVDWKTTICVIQTFCSEIGQRLGVILCSACGSLPSTCDHRLHLYNLCWDGAIKHMACTCSYYNTIHVHVHVLYHLYMYITPNHPTTHTYTHTHTHTLSLSLFLPTYLIASVNQTFVEQLLEHPPAGVVSE